MWEILRNWEKGKWPNVGFVENFPEEIIPWAEFQSLSVSGLGNDKREGDYLTWEQHVPNYITWHIVD